MKPHRHAEVIKAWVDGLPVEVMDGRTGTWVDMAGPDICPITGFDGPGEYRVKPERVYPVTRMNGTELCQAFDKNGRDFGGLLAVANAALRHAIDAGQVVTMDDHTTATTVHRMRGEQFADERSERRDMAVARAVGAANLQIGNLSESELARIIATVKD